MRKLFILLLPFLWAACTSGPRTVENPLIETANTMTLDISRVELTDTATILTVDAYFNPHMWIRIDSRTYLRADGRKYAMTRAEGITPDSLFWMPESGEATFRLTFQPLPLRTKSFDFIESDCEECFKLFGIDLTGKTEYEAPQGIPAEALAINGNAPMPAPIFQIGETTVDLHLLNYRKEFGKEINLYVNTLLGGQDEYIASIDSVTGVATFRFMQYGPAQAFAVIGHQLRGGTFWLAPGEHAEFYTDMRITGLRAISRRAGFQRPALRQMYAKGTYANLNNWSNNEQYDGRYSMNLYSGQFADYKMSAKDYVAHVVKTYQTLADSIAQDTLPPLGKELHLCSLKEEAVAAILQGDYIREQNYRAAKQDWDYKHPVKGIDKLTPKDQAVICQLFDINDPMLLMGERVYDYTGPVVYEDDAWMKVAGIEGGLIGSLRKFARLIQKAKGGELADEDLKVFSEDESFYVEALRKMQQTTLDKLKEVEGKAVIEPTPEVPVEQLFDAIVSPYKGKVVFVDFWNTWCGPCRASIRQTEPLKSSELNDGNLVWIYIANETSPIAQYKTMIPDIRGKHFRLNDKQWAYLCDKFQIDGIPSYVVVDKDGSYRLRNDLRDHNLLVPTLKEKLAQD